MDSAQMAACPDQEALPFDEYGFVIFPSCESPENERCHDYKERNFSDREMTAWQKLLSSWDVSRLRTSSKVTKFVERGVPPMLRGDLWKRLLDVEAIKATIGFKFNYNEEMSHVREQLVDLGISEYGGQKTLDHLAEMEADTYRVKYKYISMDALRHIFLDLHRSFPTHQMFMGDTACAKEGRAALFRVLAAYARYNRSVEYCQGMSVIACMFLMQMEGDEEMAFWCMVSLLERHKYLMGYFHNNLARIREHAEVFSKLLESRNPSVHAHLSCLDIHPLMYITPWFMVLFSGLPCWDTVLACWDLMLLQGHVALFRISLAVMEVCSDLLQSSNDICKVLPILLHPPSSACRYDHLVPAILQTQIHDWEISSLAAVLEEEKQRAPRRCHSAEDSSMDANLRSKVSVEESKKRKLRDILVAFTPSGKRKSRPSSVDRNKPRSSRGLSVSRPDSVGKLRTRKNADTAVRYSLRGIQNNSPHGGMVRKPSRRSLEVKLPPEAMENSSPTVVMCKNGLEVPVRRSPRLAPGRALRVMNDSLESRLWPCLKEATHKHAFRSFHTPKPLSRHHSAVSTPPFIASPDIELKPMKMALEIMH